MHETPASDTIHRPSGSPAEHVQEVLLNELKSARYLDLIRRLQQTAHDPTVVESTVNVARTRQAGVHKVAKRIHQAGQASNNAKIHETRIKTKRARYAAELAEPTVRQASHTLHQQSPRRARTF